MMLLFFLISCFFMQEAFGTNSCNCDGKRKEVCGNDDNTYISQCIMSCEGVQRNHNGSCTVGDCIKNCPTTVDQEICASDFKTYDNECTMTCTNSSLTKLGNGTCPCACPYNLDYVCGTDGVTYDNPCLLNCARISKKSDGQCPPDPICKCPRIYDPVCGKDDNSYSNECLMKCNGVEKKHNKECKP